MSQNLSTFTITLQGLPASPNRLHVHWATRAKEAKKWRTMAAYMARSQRPLKPMSRVRISIIRASSRPVDIDNGIASIKPVLDGLKDAQVIEDDNPDVVREIHFQNAYAKPKAGFIKITVEEIV